MAHDQKSGEEAGHGHGPVQTAAHLGHTAETAATSMGLPVPGEAQMAVDGLNMFSGVQQMVSPQGDDKGASRGGGLLDFLGGAIPMGVELLTHNPMASQATAGLLTQGRMTLDMMMGGGLNSRVGGVMSGIGSFFGFGGDEEEKTAAPAPAPAAPAPAPAPAPQAAAPPARVFPKSPLGDDSDVFERLSR